MIGLSAQGGSYLEGSDKIEIYITEESNLKPYCNDHTNTLNSIKVINKFINKFEDIPQYSKASLNRHGAAAVLSLQSYDWCFDVVPCFFTTRENNGRKYYLIPDGAGNWKKTDPRIDKDRTRDVNGAHNGNILNVIRTVKFWNHRTTMPSIGSYLLETLILDYYEHHPSTASEFVDFELPNIFQYISEKIFHPIQDVKGIQGDLNDLPMEIRQKIARRASVDREKAANAIDFETEKDYVSAIGLWREVFGDAFPEYG